MYADRVDSAAKTSIKDRLNGNSVADSSRRREITGKRQRLDDKWKHDLYEDNRPRVSNRKIDAQDLRLKLQRRSFLQASPGSGVRDLREKLYGTMNSQLMNADRPKIVVAKPSRKSGVVEAPEPEIKKITSVASRKRSKQKLDSSVDVFLQSLGLEKYLITFQAEEVDMTALVHMTDEDLKALGIPMVNSS
uniref:SAM domain-containing protein n=1 Tax=Populus trichocarpa TaxID=3694 RepID=A9P9C7_POPTR|nr:unknown [Populus trichocarpa]